LDERGRTADVYFHAACGGRTTSIADLWGVASPAYLRGVADEACAALPHRQWQQTIPAATLTAALRGDERSNVGARLNNITVTKRDASGRAAMVTIDGARRRTLRGWDFALIVNRVLGWSTLKSAKFDVRRAGDAFAFRGSGLGHGLGLCQEGAHLMARRGATAERILAHYFPGTQTKRQAAFSTPELIPASFAPPRAVLSSEHFRATFPAQLPPREVEAVLHTLEAAHAELARRLKAASLYHPLPGPVTVNIHASTGDFVGATGQPAWAAAATSGRTVQLQPLAVLRRRGVLDETLRHEYAHVVIESLGRDKMPRWLAEGLAIHVAGEGARLARFAPTTKLSRDELERRLARPSSAVEMRMLYAAAAAEVQAVIRAEGEAGAWRRVARP
jgi:stage II sporulation protein D